MVKDIVPGFYFRGIPSVVSFRRYPYAAMAGNIVVHFLFIFELEAIADRAVDHDIVMKFIAGFITQGVVIALRFYSP